MKECKKNIFLVLLLVGIFSLIVPILLGCFYSVPAVDDFSFSNEWIMYEGSHKLYLIEFVKNKYMSWQGTYTGLFFCGFPLYYYLGINMLRLFLFFVTFAFLLSFIILFVSGLQIVGIKDKQLINGGLFLSLLCFVFFLGQNNLGEVFYWYTGASVYTIPLTFGIYSIIFYLRYEIHSRRVYLILGSLFAIAGVGGALNISGFICSVLLGILILELCYKKRIRKNIFIPFFAFGGALINACAPGNFVRHQAFDDSVNGVYAIGQTIIRVNQSVVRGIKEEFLVLIFFCGFLYGYYRLRDIEGKTSRLLFFTIWGYVTIMITDFPFVLGYGYGVGNTYIPERSLFIEQIAIALVVVMISLYLGIWVACSKMICLSNASIFSLILICVIHSIDLFDIVTIRELTPYKMIWHISNGDFAKQANRQQSILTQIEESDDVHVIAYIDKKKESEWSNIHEVGITEDWGAWTNIAISQFYNKGTVGVVYYVTD